MTKPLSRGRELLSALLILGASCLSAQAQGVITQTEPDDSIGTANATGLTAGSSGIRVAYGNNGDGAYGPLTGNGTGDMDFYKVSAAAGQKLNVSLKNASTSDDFDSLLGIYYYSGGVATLLAVNDDEGNGSRASSLTYTTTAAGDYYVCVSNWINVPDADGSIPGSGSLPADPLTAGTGPGSPGGTPGPYQIFIGLDYTGPIPQFEGSGKANPTPRLSPIKFFGTSYATSPLKISNTGPGPWTITAASITGPDAAKFSVPDLRFPLTLAPGASRTVKVLINTAGSTALMSAALDLTSNDPEDITYSMSYLPLSPVTGNGTFEAKMVYSTVGLTTMDLADQTLAGTNVGTSVTVQTPAINYGTGADGKFASDMPFFNPGSMDNFVLQVKGTFFIKTAGHYTFYGYSDDGQRLKIDDVELYSYNDANTDHFGEADLTAGPHTLEYTMFEGGGGNSAELQIAKEPGSFAAYADTTWELLEAYGPDTDGDGIADYLETKVGTNPTVADANADPDGDTLSNTVEIIKGTSPILADTDNDGLKDNVETGTGIWVSTSDTGTNPLVADTDNDGFLDGVENPGVASNGVAQPGTDPNKADTDGDTFADYSEVAFGTNPKDPASKPALTFQQVFSENFETANPHSSYTFNALNGTTTFVAGTYASDTPAEGTVAQLTGMVGGSHNSLSFDSLDISSTAAAKLSFDFRIGFNQDDFGTSADGFGIGLFRTSVYGQHGVSPLIVDTKAWENPSGAGGYPDALFIGFGVYGTDTIRLIGPAAPTVPLATYNPTSDLVANISSGPKPYNRAIITIVTNSPTSSVVSMEIIRDVYGAATHEQVFTSVPVPGFQITSESLRLVAGGRTGSYVTQTELDNITYAIQVKSNPSLVFSSSHIGSGFLADFYDGSAQAVNPATVQVTVNGTPLTVSPVKTGNNTTVSYSLPAGTLLPPGANTVVFNYTTTTGTPLTESRSFTVDPYVTLPASLALPASSAGTPGFDIKTVQMDPIIAGGIWPNRLDYVEGILPGVTGSPFNGGNVADPTGAVNGLYHTDVINFEQEGLAAGFFTGDSLVPGIPGTTSSTDNYVIESRSWVNFPVAGVYQFGVTADDGFRLSYGHSPVPGVAIVSPAASARILAAAPSIASDPAGGISGPYPNPPAILKVVAAVPADATATLTNAAAIAGNIALIDRGTNAFAAKLQFAQAAGAVGAIIVNQNNPDAVPIVMGGDGPAITGVTIPGVMVSKADGDALKALLSSPEGLKVQFGPDNSTTLGKADLNQTTIFQTAVSTPGLYPLRFINFEGGGGASVEWYSIDSEGGKHLMNDPNDEAALKVYSSLVTGTAPTISISRTGGSVVITYTGTLQSSTTLSGFTTVTGATSPYTVPAGSPTRLFFRSVQ